jgi:uncharacterized protein YprB with RNaseH-like and TPR domain
VKTAIFDIETTSLDAVGAGFLLCVVIQDFHTGEQYTHRLDDYKKIQLGKEKPLVRDVLAALSSYDLLVGHNINRFDLHFLKTRAMRLGLDWSLYPLTYDTLPAFKRVGYRTVMNAFGKPSAGLDMVIDALDGVQAKTKIYPATWWQSVWGDKQVRKMAMNAIVEHCQSDVKMNAEIYPALLRADMRASVKRVL